MNVPAYIHLFLYRPAAVLDGVARVERAGLIAHAPNPWQLTLGVLRMWQRVLFRGETIGNCTNGRVRDTWRARLLRHKPFRLPALLVERAVAPLDFTGLLSSRERIIKHLLGAHHDGAAQFIYDLEILSAHEDGLEMLARAVDAVVEEDSPRSRWLRDLVVYEGYHEELREVVHRSLAEGVKVCARAKDDPDLSFAAYLGWCARQPATPAATLAALVSGRFSLQAGLAS